VVDNDHFENDSKHGSSKLIELLHQHLQKKLSDYMVPSAFVLLDQFPLTQNGKVDRKALPQADFSTQQEAYVAPRTALEQQLCELCKEILGVEQVGITDDFFKLGGDSLSAVRFVNQLKKRGHSISLSHFYKKRKIMKF